jgi:hypothetical protein
MSDLIKTKPSDGSEETEKQEEEKKQKQLSEEETLEKFVDEAEKEVSEMEIQKKEALEKLKRDRKKSVEEEKKEKEAEDKDGQRLIYGEKVESQKSFTIKKGFGIFNSKGRRDDFGSSKADREIEHTIKAGAHGISVKKQREFIQLLGKFHGLKDKKLNTIDKDEVMSLEAGLRRGSANAKFNEFRQQLKKEGTIRNSTDVKKFFTRREIKKMSNALLGKEDHNAYKRVEKSDLANKRAGSTDSGPVKKF